MLLVEYGRSASPLPPALPASPAVPSTLLHALLPPRAVTRSTSGSCIRAKPLPSLSFSFFFFDAQPPKKPWHPFIAKAREITSLPGANSPKPDVEQSLPEKSHLCKTSLRAILRGLLVRELCKSGVKRAEGVFAAPPLPAESRRASCSSQAWSAP